MKNKWVKPFSSGMTCIDSINAECLRGLSFDECKKTCESSSYCQNGYYVKLPNEEKSYCVPLNGLSMIDNDTNIFEKSLYDPKISEIFTPDLNVEIFPFSQTKNIQENDNIIQNKYIYFIEYFDHKTNMSLYLNNDLYFDANINNAIPFTIIPQKRTYTSTNTTSPYLQNGQVINLNISDTNNILKYMISLKSFIKLPISITFGASTSFDINELHFIQCVKTYPFIFPNYMYDDDIFAIRVSTIPITNECLYAFVDDSYKLSFKSIPKESMIKNLEKYKQFKFTKKNQKENINQQSKLIPNQTKYLLDFFYKKDPTNQNIFYIFQICISVILILLISIYIKFKIYI